MIFLSTVDYTVITTLGLMVYLTEEINQKAFGVSLTYLHGQAFCRHGSFNLFLLINIFLFV